MLPFEPMRIAVGSFQWMDLSNRFFNQFIMILLKHFSLFMRYFSFIGKKAAGTSSVPSQKMHLTLDKVGRASVTCSLQSCFQDFHYQDQ